MLFDTIALCTSIISILLLIRISLKLRAMRSRSKILFGDDFVTEQVDTKLSDLNKAFKVMLEFVAVKEKFTDDEICFIRKQICKMLDDYKSDIKDDVDQTEKVLKRKVGFYESIALKTLITMVVIAIRNERATHPRS
jgi:hypothetical protein